MFLLMDRDTVTISVYERIGMDIYDPTGLRISASTICMKKHTMAATRVRSYLRQPAGGDPTAEAVV
jgi:hypothetical protein